MSRWSRQHPDENYESFAERLAERADMENDRRKEEAMLERIDRESFSETVPSVHQLVYTTADQPNDDVIGKNFIGLDGVYYCDSYEPRYGYWMTNIQHPTTDRRNVSERAIHRTFHRTRQARHAQMVTALKQGAPIRANGYDGAFVRKYSDGMVEVRLPGGVACVPVEDVAVLPKRA